MTKLSELITEQTQRVIERRNRRRSNGQMRRLRRRARRIYLNRLRNLRVRSYCPSCFSPVFRPNSPLYLTSPISSEHHSYISLFYIPIYISISPRQFELIPSSYFPISSERSSFPCPSSGED